MALTTSFPYLISIDRALEMAMTADILNANDAFDKNLITAIEKNPLEKARVLAKKIANKSPDAIRSIKRLFYQTWHKNDQFSLSLEAQLQLQLMGKSNLMEAVKSSLSGSRPDFLNSKI